jgi:uncharacterized membrane protein YebE (DUF533 family)
MDTNTLAVSVSVGALGATLAYLGYQNYTTKDRLDEQNTEPSDEQSDEQSAKNNDTEEDQQKKEEENNEKPQNKIVAVLTPVGENDEHAAKEAEKKEAEVEVQEAVKSEWGQFWQGEYDAHRQQSTSTQEVQAN